jgi:4-diphosphocytidyl-2-C-methyl-D-erythritol kinase
VTGPAARSAAQAKLNLHLRVLSREESGFHAIETIFHRIDLADDLLVEITAAEKTIDVDGADAGPAERNLAWRAATAYAAHAGWPRGFRIELTKKIPVGAGLGGGSADAAAVLRILNSLSPQPIRTPGLLHLAAGLGADVSFLASDAVMALAWGRGERMLELSPLPRRDILLMTPEFSVSTADAYRWLDEDRERSESGESAGEPALLDLEQLNSWDSIARFARNDFEAPVMARHPRLEGYLERLRRSRATFAMMTGSGSTIFGVLDTPANFAKVPPEHRSRVTTTKTSIDVVQPVRVG